MTSRNGIGITAVPAMAGMVTTHTSTIWILVDCMLHHIRGFWHESLDILNINVFKSYFIS